MTEVEPAERPERRSQRRRLEQPRNAVPLIHALATGERVTDLAGEYGVSHVAIIHFRDRHLEDIERVRCGLDIRLMTGLWITNRQARLATLQTDVEYLEGELVNVAAELVSPFLRVKHAAIRQAAEELGALRVGVDVSTTVRHEIVGIDVEVLR